MSRKRHRLRSLRGLQRIGKECWKCDNIRYYRNLSISLAIEFGTVPWIMSYHIEPLILIPLRRLPTNTINPNLLPIIQRRLTNPLDGGLQIIMELPENRTSDIISQIPRPDEEDVYSWDFGDFLDLSFISSILWKSDRREIGLYILKSLLGLNLHYSKKRIVRLLEILHARNIPRGSHREGTTEASPTDRRKFGRFD